jgi:hypothetical protein
MVNTRGHHVWPFGGVLCLPQCGQGNHFWSGFASIDLILSLSKDEVGTLSE